MIQPVDSNLSRALFSVFLFAGFSIPSTASSHGPPRVDTQVIGRLGFPKKFKSKEIQVTHSKVILIEEYVPGPVPTPKGFEDWDQAKRANWFSTWEKTKAGKAYRLAEDKRFSKLKKYESTVKKNSEFKFTKVQAGKYDLAGELTIKYQKKKYVSEFLAQIKVSDVEEVSLDRIELQLSRVLQIGERLPGFKIKSTKGTVLNDKKLKKSNSLIVFWAPQNFDQSMLDKLSRMNQGKNIQVIAIGFGDRDEHDAHIKKPFAKHHCYLESFSADICQDFGIRGLPSFWLIDPDGEIQAVDSTFVEAKFDLEKVVNDRVRGTKF